MSRTDTRVGVAVLSFALFFALGASLETFHAWDTAAAQWTQTLETPFLTLCMQGFTFLGGMIGLAVVSLLLILWPRTRRRFGLPAGALLLLSAGLNLCLKQLYQRPRPVSAGLLGHTFSFPSGHSMNAFVFFGALLLLICLASNRKAPARVWAKVGFVLTVVLIGFSRIYLGMHYLTDVLGGFLMAGGVLSLGEIVFRRLGADKRDE